MHNDMIQMITIGHVSASDASSISLSSPGLFEAKQLDPEKNTLQCGLVKVNYACQMHCSWEISLENGQMETKWGIVGLPIDVAV